MNIIAALDLIETRVKDIRKHILQFPKDTETVAEDLDNLRLIVIGLRGRMEDDHR
jgi:hypothetical protein